MLLISISLNPFKHHKVILKLNSPYELKKGFSQAESGDNSLSRYLNVNSSSKFYSDSQWCK